MFKAGKVVEVIARISGAVSYTNGKKRHFAAHLDRNGNVSYNGQIPSLLAGPITSAPPTANTGYPTSRTAMVDANVGNQLNQLIAALPAHDPTYAPGVAGNGWTVKSVEAEFSGRVTLLTPNVGDASWEDWVVQYSSLSNNPGASVPEGGMDGTTSVGSIISGENTAWGKARATAAARTALQSMFPDITIT